MSGSTSPVPPAEIVKAALAPTISVANLLHASSLLGYAALAFPVITAIGAQPAPTNTGGWIGLGIQAVMGFAAVLQRPTVAAS